jgi:hypothetical protein
MLKYGFLFTFARAGAQTQSFTLISLAIARDQVEQIAPLLGMKQASRNTSLKFHQLDFAILLVGSLLF